MHKAATVWVGVGIHGGPFLWENTFKVPPNSLLNQLLRHGLNMYLLQARHCKHTSLRGTAYHLGSCLCSTMPLCHGQHLLIVINTYIPPVCGIPIEGSGYDDEKVHEDGALPVKISLKFKCVFLCVFFFIIRELMECRLEVSVSYRQKTCPSHSVVRPPGTRVSCGPQHTAHGTLDRHIPGSLWLSYYVYPPVWGSDLEQQTFHVKKFPFQY